MPGIASEARVTRERRSHGAAIDRLQWRHARDFGTLAWQVRIILPLRPRAQTLMARACGRSAADWEFLMTFGPAAAVLTCAGEIDPLQATYGRVEAIAERLRPHLEGHLAREDAELSRHFPRTGRHARGRAAKAQANIGAQRTER